MRNIASRLVVAVIALIAALPPILAAQAPAGAGAAQLRMEPDAVREWKVPSLAGEGTSMQETRPRDPYVDQRGRVWFVNQAANYVASLDPATGRFRHFGVPAGTYPHDLVVDRRGMVWFTGNRNGRILEMDPETGKITTFLMPDSTVRDPHTMIFDRRGDAWFTAQGAGVVGRLAAADGRIRLWRLARNARPYGIAIDSKGRPWFDEFGTNRIGSIDPRTGALKEYALPSDRARPRRIVITSDDAVWYGDYTRGYLGRIDPGTGAVEEWALPSGAGSLPYAMAVDDHDRVWLAETGVQPNRLVAFDTRTRSWVAAVPVGEKGPNTIRHMIFDRGTRQLWFGTDQGTIGRAKVPGDAVVP